MTACPAPAWTGLRCKGCWTMSAAAKSTVIVGSRAVQTPVLYFRRDRFQVLQLERQESGLPA
jgi:hypothetical protein